MAVLRAGMRENALLLAIALLGGCGGRANLQTQAIRGGDGGAFDEPDGGGEPVKKGAQEASTGETDSKAGVVLVCPATCAGTCIDGRCHTVLNSSQAIASALAVDRKNLYWTSIDIVGKMPIGGGDVTTLATEVGPFAELRIDATSVYYSYATGPTNSSGRSLPSAAMKVAIEGGTPITLVTGGSTSGIAIDGSYLYWSSQHVGLVSKIPLSGGDTIELASGQDSPQNIAVDKMNVYWVNRGGVVMRALLDGGALTKLAVLPDALSAIAVDATHVYVMSGGERAALYAIPIDGGEPETLATDQNYPWQMVIDDAAIYWAKYGNFRGGGVMKLTKGGRLEMLANGSAGGIAVDETSVYYSNFETKTINKITPK